jgi:hypothetical protein
MPRQLIKEGWEKVLRTHPRPEHAAALLHFIDHGVPVLSRPTRLPASRVSTYVLPSAHEHEDAISADIQAEVRAGRVFGPFSQPPSPSFICSPVGAVTKVGSTKVRRIHHLSWPRGRSLNDSIVPLPSPCASVDDAVRIVLRLGRGALMAKVDIKAAFRCIPVRAADRRLLGFWWAGGFYADGALPFGMRSSPALWGAYAAALEWAARIVVGVPDLVRYVDDYWLAGPRGSDACKMFVAAFCKLCESLGVPVSPEKLREEGTPAHLCIFLGVLIDSEKLTLSLPPKRLAAIQCELDLWSNRRSCTGTELQGLIGKLGFVCSIVHSGRTFTRRLIDALYDADAAGVRGHRRVKLPAAVFDDINWWRTFLQSWSGTSMMVDTEKPALQVFTDACEGGLGVVAGDDWTFIPVDDNLRSMATIDGTAARSMPFLEASALVLAALTFGQRWSGRVVEFMCDCQPVVAAFNSWNRTSRSPLVMAAIRSLVLLSAQHSFDFRVSFLPGVRNGMADAVSRGQDAALRELLPSAAPQPTACSATALMDWLRAQGTSSTRASPRRPEHHTPPAPAPTQPSH